MKQIICCVMIFLLSAAALPAYSAIIGTTDEEVKEIAEPILDNVLNGVTQDSYVQYSKDFDETLKEAITANRFAEIRENIAEGLGNYLYREYLGFINKEGNTVVFWKGSFDKTEDEILIKMILSNRKGQHFVTGLWYQ